MCHERREPVSAWLTMAYINNRIARPVGALTASAATVQYRKM
jgi:hypothetical protein